MWYAFQLAIMMYVMHVYKTEIAPEAQNVHVGFIAVCVAFGATWLLSMLFSGIRKLFAGIRFILNALSGKNPSNQLRVTNGPAPGIEVRLKKLVTKVPLTDRIK